MAVITVQTLQALVTARNADLPAAKHFAPIRVAWASQCAAALDAVLGPAKIDTPLRVRQFMAQLAHESGGFRSLVESLAYRDPVHLAATFPSRIKDPDMAQRLIAQGPAAIGNFVYASRGGNGDVLSGDGYRYRGRGFIMNTFRNNYAAVARFAADAGYADMDVVADPDRLGLPDGAAKAAAAFWVDNHLNVAADTGDIDEVTCVINPAMAGAAERLGWVKAAVCVWPDA
jgi:putative chitinase